MKIDDKLFRKAMSSFPSGVTIVTTLDTEGQSRGFTATAFSSLSCNPPMILICLSNKAECFQTFTSSGRFAVNILSQDYEQLAMRFATTGADKFAGGEFVLGESGLPVLPYALASLECKVDQFHPGGDHVILTGIVEHANVHEGEATVYFGGKFRFLAELVPAKIDALKLQVTALMIKAVRKETRAGTLDCRAVLDETGCDVQKAIDLIRSRGQKTPKIVWV
ncbi:flavin reductase family protein [Glaciimonas immobilis]|uniref:Flavin reductase (DIM6/NTAB) family NADH-FMN oxidoreductase RutF n=1 Tax=Glaciimonas immobilis TaxID=728004 RepID=A0A840RRH2_9BURK|nr:flavin reductase family protein [Glaciimonas immobilis]KAF3999538.1 flavin reductase [Glaciimonas immobilis]MBB5199079.1 flavin reductase (DIM6/NTAB) family NADH-FMN oxidoreductase RutF [Glaciimonas immobilis]